MPLSTAHHVRNEQDEIGEQNNDCNEEDFAHQKGRDPAEHAFKGDIRTHSVHDIAIEAD